MAVTMSPLFARTIKLLGVSALVALQVCCSTNVIPL